VVPVHEDQAFVCELPSRCERPLDRSRSPGFDGGRRVLGASRQAHQARADGKRFDEIVDPTEMVGHDVARRVDASLGMKLLPAVLSLTAGNIRERKSENHPQPKEHDSSAIAHHGSSSF
jgi:hypothetical protein